MNLFEDIDSMKAQKARDCSLCKNQGICKAYALFKEGVEPHILNGKDIGLVAENLAWICKLYVENVPEKSPIKKMTKVTSTRDF